ncbi:hypothetical protein R4227_18550 [Gordonia amicalis]|uniref:hypothetical protein n=1 Tax=Gordonia amicalis TaxID=89053 RepID=UPI0029547309|nr:hypothetical protein [Gordonia amicalis]MDV7102062.1 hypothetical protein [Gordonia amicalis]
MSFAGLDGSAALSRQYGYTDIREALTTLGLVPALGNLSLSLQTGALTCGPVNARVVRAVATADADILVRGDGTASQSGDFLQFRVGGGSRMRVSSAGITYSNGFASSISTKTANYTIGDNDHTILANGSITVTLPNAAALAGRFLTIKNITASDTVTVTSTGGTIDGATMSTLAGGSAARYQSNGANWYKI